MEDNRLNELLSSDEILKEQFLENNNSLVNITTNYKKVEFDYSWLDKIEETILYIDDIIRNPKKFIVQEEEVVPVERAKKITLETIKHLAQHTNYIQKIDADGTITPNKVLNVHKEESYDIYENRFIYSLLMNLNTFMQKRKMITEKGSFCNINKKLNYDAKTKVGSENISVSIKIKSSSFDDLSVKSSNGTVQERIEKIELIIHDYLNSQFIKELLTGNVLMVKSPIRKTNVILKNPNFQKALELWEFIEQYDVNDKKEIEEDNSFENVTDVKNEMDNTFLLDYLILNDFYQKKEVTPTKIRKYQLNKVIQSFVDSNSKIDERKFKKLLMNEFKKVKEDRRKYVDNIINVVNKEVIKYSKSYDNLMELLNE